MEDNKLEGKIKKAKELAEAISKVPGIASCRVDDWNQFGEFGLFAQIPCGSGRPYMPLEKGYDLRKVIPKIKAILKGHHYKIFSPERIYEKGSLSDSLFFRGYAKGSITIDVNL